MNIPNNFAESLDPDPMQIHPDTDSGQTLYLKFYMKNILKVDFRSNIPTKVQKPF
jgi:hypothetical protein